MMNIRFAALGAALVLGVSTVAVAQPPAGARTGRHHGAVAGADSTRRGGRGGQQALLRGIQLSETQKTQLQSIQQKYAGERRALVQQVRGNSAGATRPDSATRDRLRTQSRSLMERQFGEVRGILTADQRRTFDKNVTVVRERLTARQGQGGRGAQKGAAS
jgi:Spy/CpxP family protein refolding chaperone